MGIYVEYVEHDIASSFNAFVVIYFFLLHIRFFSKLNLVYHICKYAASCAVISMSLIICHILSPLSVISWRLNTCEGIYARIIHPFRR